MEEGDALVVVAELIGVGHIVLPHSGIVVDIGDEHAETGQRGVEACRLTVLEHIVLVLIVGIIDDVGLTVVGERGHIVDHRISLQFDGDGPTAGHALVGGVVGGLEAVAVVGTHIHQVVFLHTVVAAVGGVIHIREAHAVGELMADGADAGDLIGVRYLIGAGIHVDFVAALTVFQAGIIQRIHVGPNGVLIFAVGLAVAGIQHEDFLNLLVAIPVVGREVGGVADGIEGVDNHLLGILVVASAVVGTVVGIFVGKGYGSGNVEAEIELTVALRAEVVAHAALEVAFVEVKLIGKAVVERFGVGHGELLVAELHEDDESAAAALENLGVFGSALGHLQACSIGLDATRLGGSDDLSAVNLLIGDTIGRPIGIAVGILPEVGMLVTDKHGADC